MFCSQLSVRCPTFCFQNFCCALLWNEYSPGGLEAVASHWWFCRLLTWLCRARFWRWARNSAVDAGICDAMNGGGWMGLKLGIAGSNLWLLFMGPSGLNLVGLRMSMTLKLVSLVGFCSSLLFAGCCCLFEPLSLLVDMLRGWVCGPPVELLGGEALPSRWSPWDLITEFILCESEGFPGLYLASLLRSCAWFWWLNLDATVKWEFLWCLKWPWLLNAEFILFSGEETQAFGAVVVFTWSAKQHAYIAKNRM